MTHVESITMSMREIDRLKTIQAVIDGHLRPSTAASRLQLTKRQVNRLVQRYRREGADRTGVASTGPAGPSPITARLGRHCADNHSGALFRLRTHAGVREAARTPWGHARQGNRAQVDDRGRLVDSAQAAPAIDLPAAQSSALPGRTGANRRQ
jgi:hypothetical protein